MLKVKGVSVTLSTRIFAVASAWLYIPGLRSQGCAYGQTFGTCCVPGYSTAAPAGCFWEVCTYLCPAPAIPCHACCTACVLPRRPRQECGGSVPGASAAEHGRAGSPAPPPLPRTLPAALSGRVCLRGLSNRSPHPSDRQAGADGSRAARSRGGCGRHQILSQP